jgi:glycogen debranching enzyme
MRRLNRLFRQTAFLLASLSALHAQKPPLNPIDAIPFDPSGPVLRARTQATQPFTVAGPQGVLVGQQDGAFESWILPVKLFSHFAIEANVEGYGVPIDVNAQSASIEVRPDRTIITYSHPAFTVRQIMFSPDHAADGASSTPGAPSLPSASAEERVGHQARTGPIVLFEFDCLHPTDFTFRFIPELKWMWPERNEGVPGPEWVPSQAPIPSEPGAPNDRSSSSGYYVLHTDYPNLAAALTIPGARPGILAPYQERPQVHPLELLLHIDPVHDKGKLFPLLMAAGISHATATNAVLAESLAQLDAQIPALYTAHAASWKNRLAHSTSIDTPDSTLNEAFQWAVASIEQLKTPTIPGQSSPPHAVSDPQSSQPRLVTGHDFSRAATGPENEEGALAPETALVAGYFTSADSARPGFGWFFGRDALYTLYAVNGYGDFALSKSELEFLIHRQRADGKIMHEYSQTAAAIDWQAFPYMYAAADSTPLFLLAVADYVRSSGDTAFLTTHRDAIERAWAFETDPAHDTDHDGIYDNSQGTGWVESWPTGMPHQEIYLALLDQQASSAFAFIEGLLGDKNKSTAAQHRADTLAKTINAEYALPAQGCYAFSHNSDGTNDRTTTVYPALAWWDPSGKRPILDKAEDCLRNFVASALNTDWGLRDVSNQEKIYDGLSYHQGSVWPLFTGWAALAEYRGNQPLAGYQLLMENANLTRAQDLGSVTELLSGDFFVPFGRSTSHQLWSSAMVITPTLRGLFGITVDAQSKTITVNPHLPATWSHAEVRDLRIGSGTVDLVFTQTHDALTVSLHSTTGVTLRSDPSLVHSVSNGNLVLARAPVEIAPILNPPLPGNRSQSVRVLDQHGDNHKLTFTLEGPANSDAQLPLVLNAMNLNLHAEGATLPTASDAVPHTPGALPALHVHFPSGTGFQTLTVTLTW